MSTVFYFRSDLGFFGFDLRCFRSGLKGYRSEGGCRGFDLGRLIQDGYGKGSTPYGVVGIVSSFRYPRVPPAATEKFDPFRVGFY